ncbi:MAG: metallophosphoesterase [Lachnospiraceae bacterium]|nr:metallophosphoesterase [Lachnospiraceae bacterium]
MKYILILAGLFLLALLCFYIYRECIRIDVTEYTLTSSLLKKDTFRIVMLSDLHETVHGKDNEEVLERIDGLAPDIVIFAGDMITASDFHPLNYDAALSLIGRIAEKYPLYYGIGNHEEKLKRPPFRHIKNWEYYTGELAKLKVSILQNEKVFLPEAGICIYGLDLEYQYYRKIKDYPIPDGYLEEKLGKADSSSYTILLAHLPDQLSAYAKWGPDLVLSGHVHGGVIRLPFLGGVISPQLKLFPHFDSGLFYEGKTTMILSRGIGTHTIPLRINNSAEIVSITLKREE